MQFAFRTQHIPAVKNGQTTADELTPVEREQVRRQWELDNPDECGARPDDLPVHCTQRTTSTGHRYFVNPDAPEEGTDVHHDRTCAVHLV